MPDETPHRWLEIRDTPTSWAAGGRLYHESMLRSFRALVELREMARRHDSAATMAAFIDLALGAETQKPLECPDEGAKLRARAQRFQVEDLEKRLLDARREISDAITQQGAIALAAAGLLEVLLQHAPKLSTDVLAAVVSMKRIVDDHVAAIRRRSKAWSIEPGHNDKLDFAEHAHTSRTIIEGCPLCPAPEGILVAEEEPMKSVTLGDRAKDRISGFAGIVIGRGEYLYGCRQLLLAPELTGDKEPASHWFDEDRIELVQAGVIPAPATAAAAGGGPLAVTPPARR